jgi:hypothetical protein
MPPRPDQPRVVPLRCRGRRLANFLQLPPEPANDCECVEEPRIYAHGPTPTTPEPAATLGIYAKADASTVAVPDGERREFRVKKIFRRAYSFTNNNSLTFNSAGIAVNGGSATFTNNHVLRFHDFSTAGDATITNKSGGDVDFLDRSTAGNARLINNSGGTFDFSSSTGPSGSGNLSAGSIEGGGVFYSGATSSRSAATI